MLLRFEADQLRHILHNNAHFPLDIPANFIKILLIALGLYVLHTALQVLDHIFYLLQLVGELIYFVYDLFAGVGKCLDNGEVYEVDGLGLFDGFVAAEGLFVLGHLLL